MNKFPVDVLITYVFPDLTPDEVVFFIRTCRKYHWNESIKSYIAKRIEVCRLHTDLMYCNRAGRIEEGYQTSVSIDRSSSFYNGPYGCVYGDDAHQWYLVYFSCKERLIYFYNAWRRNLKESGRTFKIVHTISYSSLILIEGAKFSQFHFVGLGHVVT